MKSFVACLALATASLLVLALVQASPLARRVLAAIGHLVALPFVAIAAAVSIALDFCLMPRGPRRLVPPGSYLVWAIVGALPLVLFLVDRRWPLPVPFGVDTGFLLVAAVLVPTLALFASVLIVADDLYVMDGIVPVAQRRFSGARVAGRLPVKLAAGAFLVVYAAAIAYWLMAVRGDDLVAAAPATGHAVADALLVALSALPTRPVLLAADWLFGEHNTVAFRTNAVAVLYAAGFGVAGGLLLLGLVAAYVMRRWHIRAIVTEIARSRDDDYTFLVLRARRAPEAVKRALLGAAIFERQPVRQARLLEAARDMGIHGLPAAFCRHIGAYPEEIQKAGLDRATELYRQGAAEFDASLADRILKQALRALRRGRLTVEPMKRLVRLVLTVVTTSRKAAIAIRPRRRDALAAAVRVELGRTTAEGDPALRGYLRELQSALGVPVATKRLKPKAAGGPLAKAPPIYAAARLSAVPIASPATAEAEPPVPAPTVPA